MNVLSIQSAVAYGHVGNSVAAFALQRLGHEVWPVDTVRFSNHPGHGGFRGTVTSPEELNDLIEGIAERGWLASADAVLTGYLGSPAQGTVAAAAAARVRAGNPDALWAVDPVIGDHGRVFVKDGIPQFLRSTAVPAADVLTPNAFELEYLTGLPCQSLGQALVAAKMLLGPSRGRIVVATGLTLSDHDPGTLTTLAVRAGEAWSVSTPAIAHPANGAGDLFAALFLGRFLPQRKMVAALALATSSVHAIVARSAAAGARELQIIAAQDELVAPRQLFEAIPVPEAGL
ncbi:MAG TPA: pyridoxal kinase PdxY [Alphaproteobacteria bacterium]|nr:pyridoxal kinase PdxY [Alphaproteobacteria bacterium]